MTIPASTTSVRERLAGLLREDLSFRNGEGVTLMHSLHAFAARFPAGLPRHFIKGLSEPGETVLDPMAGSGATLLEGLFCKRNVIGVDLDPLALKLCRAKTTWLCPQQVRHAGQAVLDTASESLESGNPAEEFLQRADADTRKFIDYWFLPETQSELAALVMAAEQEPDQELREFCNVLISSVIVTKSGGVSMARDLAHSRPHRVDSKVPRSAVRMFAAQLRQAALAMEQARDNAGGTSTVIAGDSRRLPLAADSVDLIVTSPPYANAIDYMRAHKFSLVWLGKPVKRLGALRGKYIGNERLADVVTAALPPIATEAVNALADLDHKKAIILRKYLGDMALAIGEMRRVLRPGRAAVIVVGPSTMRGMRIQTQDYLAAIAGQVGFDVVTVAGRPLDRDRRMMPARWGKNGDSTIEQRMHEEYVVGLVKPDNCRGVPTVSRLPQKVMD